MWMPKAPTLDPFEKFRMNRGVRHFGQVLKSLNNALENEAKTIAISLQKSFRTSMKNNFDFQLIF